MAFSLKGQKLYNKARNVIPGGTMLHSKRPELFLPEHCPVYFSKAKGCRVWDLEGNRLTDVSMMGNGACVLGYGNEEVDQAVHETVNNGNLTTLNCAEEVELAEKMIEMHPWADMVHFSRTGGEANAVSVRIARAASGRDKIAFCGYHGWHDWYLAANLQQGDGNKKIDFNTAGVPEGLRGTAFPFSYNNFEELEEILSQHDIGIIKLEVSRNRKPENEFLKKIRLLADEKDIVLIFDEVSSGFRQTFGGIHKLYGVEPDLAVFGKSLGNGYAISAVLGRKEVMEHAQNSFISSTFWTERIGPSAALKSLEVMEREKSWEVISRQGKKFKENWKQLAEQRGVKISVSGLDSLVIVSFDSKYALEYKTLMVQEMLKKGFLATTSVFMSTVHTDEILNLYFDALGSILTMIKECEYGRDIYDLLEGPVCKTGIKQLN